MDTAQHILALKFFEIAPNGRGIDVQLLAQIIDGDAPITEQFFKDKLGSGGFFPHRYNNSRVVICVLSYHRDAHSGKKYARLGWQEGGHKRLYRRTSRAIWAAMRCTGGIA